MEATLLLDCCVLIAISEEANTAHTVVTDWFDAIRPIRFATCPITQMALLRHLVRVFPKAPFHEAIKALQSISDLPGHEFWPDNYDCLSLPSKGILGHKHVTDAYLVSLAQTHGGRVATLDRRMADVYAPTAFLVS